MAYYLQDSGNNYWAITVTTLGQWTTAPAVGPQPVPTLTLQDISSGFWQLGVTLAGQLTTASVGAQPVSSIVIPDSSNSSWQMGVTTLGQLTSLQVPTVIGNVISPEFIWLGGDDW